MDEARVVAPDGRFVNFLDLAAVSVPMDVPGLPLGFQIATRRFEDALDLQLAALLRVRCEIHS
ncbi:hypothetical protein RUR49_19730 [Pseudoxanthobacter sp. M-2]|uniref:hypothetical protein n=1 Tax=Pseudoxanthobacter sp. M-2 TaxID=3078754 RepID=UPI0038FC34ED